MDGEPITSDSVKAPPSMIEREMAALKDDNGGVSEKSEPKQPRRSVDDVPSEDDLDAIEAEEGAPAKEDDGYGDIRKRFTPTQIEEMAARDANLRAAAITNQDQDRMGEERRQRERDLAEMRALSQRQQNFEQGLIQLAKTNPELGVEYLKTIARDNERYGTNPQVAAAAPSGEMATLQQKFDELQKNVAGFAYGVNSAAVRQEIFAQAAGMKIFKLADKLGELDESVDRIVGRLVAKDRANPGTINPLDSRSVRAALSPLIKEEEQRLTKRRRVTLQDYIEDRRTSNAKAPTATRGSASAARAVDDQRAKVSPFASTASRIKSYAKDFQAVSRRPSTGTSAEIG